MAGYSGTPLPKKLGIREGTRVATIHAPAHLCEILVPWPAGASIEPFDFAAGPASADDRFDVILLFVNEERALAEGLVAAPPRLKVAGGLWVAWPKMKSPLSGGLKDSHVRTAGLEAGLVDNKVCAIDADWSGLRFVFRKEDRPRIKAERGG